MAGYFFTYNFVRFLAISNCTKEVEMSNLNVRLNVRMKAHVTFIWNNNETMTLAADETARDKVMELKIKIDAWGQPRIITGVSCSVVSRNT